MKQHEITSSQKIIQEIKSIAFQAAKSEKSGQYQEALDSYEEARFIALDSGLIQCHLIIDPKSANVEAELASSKRDKLTEMLQTAILMEENRDLVRSLDIYNKALKTATDIDASDIISGIIETKARLERELMPIKASKQLAGLRSVGNMLVVFAIIVALVFSLKIVGSNLIFFNAYMILVGMIGLLAALLVSVKHVKTSALITIGGAAYYTAILVYSLCISILINFVHSHDVLSTYSSASIQYNLLYLYSIISISIMVNAIIIALLGFAIPFFLAAQRTSRQK
ncbi:MAG TPA: hypothetical protein VKM55_28310 [Candidatus Lokiarchaeia archaeon]|nr:hypothetical protein [Candidatus Lokiarchaeia archaeon]